LPSGLPDDLRAYQAVIVLLETELKGDRAVLAKASFLGIDAERAPHDHAIQPLAAVLGTFVVGTAVQALADVHLGKDPFVELLLGQALESARLRARLLHAFGH
jgi:hypothetical protein